MKNRSEASTFAGIPIPLTMETILDAMVIAIQDYYKVKYDVPFMEKRLRQSRAFRDRILRMDAEKERDIRLLKEGNMTLAKLMVERVEAREKRIAELEKLLREFEWQHWDTKQGDHYCLICDANKKEGHKPDCQLAKELSDGD